MIWVCDAQSTPVVARLGSSIPPELDLHEGDQVVYFALGSYAEFTAVEASSVLKVPAGLNLKQATAVLLQGMTSHYLARSTFPLKTGVCSGFLFKGSISLIWSKHFLHF